MVISQTYFYAALALALLQTATAFITSLVASKLHHAQVSKRVVVGLCFLSNLLIVGGFLVFRLLSWRGDYLQIAIACLLVCVGLTVGVITARRLGRVGFIEGLWVVATCLWLVVFKAEALGTLLGHEVATAYFTVLLLAGLLIYSLSLSIGGSLGFMLLVDGKLSLGFFVERWIGTRFLMAKRGSRVVSLITVISVFAVTVGTAGMIIVMGVMNGFSHDLRTKIMGTNAHLIVLKYGNNFSNYPSVIRELQAIPDIVAQSPFVLNEVMVSSQDNLSGAIVKGIDPHAILGVTTLASTMVEGSLKGLADPKSIEILHEGGEKPNTEGPFHSEWDKLRAPPKAVTAPVLPGIVVGQEMAKALRVFVGDTVNVVSPVGELGPTGPIPKARTFRVAGVFYTGMYEYDAKFSYVLLQEAQSFFGLGKSITGIECKVANFENTTAIAKQVQHILKGYPYYTKDWMQMNNSIFSALRLEKIAMFIILTTLIFMASLLILVTLIIVVIEKGKEIAILKSIGATDASIMKIFVTYGISIGGAGAGFGLILGVTACWLLQIFGIGLDSRVYYISSLPIKMEVLEVALVFVAAVVVSFLATIPPALYAARLRPVEGLRYE